ncbi:MAG: hypothetical protein ACOY3P_23380 [Planctomycetota bacterium]
MQRALPWILGLGLVLGCLVAPLHAAEDARPTDWMSPQAVVVVEVERPDEITDALLSPSVAALAQASPDVKKALADDGLQKLRLVADLAGVQLGGDWRTAIEKLTAGGLAWSLEPDGGSLLVIEADSPESLKKVHDLALKIAESEAQKRGRKVESADHGGVTGYSFAKNEAHCIVGNRLLISNKPETIKAALDRRAAAGNDSLSQSPNYQAARKALGTGAVATAVVNLEMLKHAPGVARALGGDDNPLAALLFSAVRESAAASNWAAARLAIDPKRVVLEALMDGKLAAESPAAFALPGEPGGGAQPVLNVPRQIAGLTLYRDLPKFYAAKEQLFPERTSGLIFFENMMEIFFTGRNVDSEVMAQAHPEIRAVVAGQAYDAAIGTPQTQIPAFAVIFRLRDPKRFSLIAEEAWQKALGLVNFTRGQQALPGLLFDKKEHAGVRYTVAYFSDATEEDREHLDSRFNFRPTLATVDEYLVISSTDQLAEDVIDALKQESAARPKPLGGTHSKAIVFGPESASALKANRQNLVLQNMTEKGNTKEQSEQEVDTLIGIAGQLRGASLTMFEQDGLQRARLEIGLGQP